MKIKLVFVAETMSWEEKEMNKGRAYEVYQKEESLSEGHAESD